MSSDIDPLELAHGLAKIASTTEDAETGRLLMLMVERLLTDAGLPADDDQRPTDAVSALPRAI